MGNYELDGVITMDSLKGIGGRQSNDEEIEKTIRELTQQMNECILKGDQRGYADFYADDGTIIGPKSKLIGRAAIDKFCFGMTHVTESRIEILELGVGGDLVYQVGKSTASWKKPDGDEGTYVCDFVYIWKKQSDGEYKIFIDCYN